MSSYKRAAAVLDLGRQTQEPESDEDEDDKPSRRDWKPSCSTKNSHSSTNDSKREITFNQTSSWKSRNDNYDSKIRTPTNGKKTIDFRTASLDDVIKDRGVTDPVVGYSHKLNGRKRYKMNPDPEYISLDDALEKLCPQTPCSNEKDQSQSQLRLYRGDGNGQKEVHKQMSMALEKLCPQTPCSKEKDQSQIRLYRGDGNGQKEVYKQMSIRIVRDLQSSVPKRTISVIEPLKQSANISVLQRRISRFDSAPAPKFNERSETAAVKMTLGSSRNIVSAAPASAIKRVNLNPKSASLDDIIVNRGIKDPLRAAKCISIGNRTSTLDPKMTSLDDIIAARGITKLKQPLTKDTCKSFTPSAHFNYHPELFKSLLKLARSEAMPKGEPNIKENGIITPSRAVGILADLGLITKLRTRKLFPEQANANVFKTWRCEVTCGSIIGTCEGPFKNMVREYACINYLTNLADAYPEGLIPKYRIPSQLLTDVGIYTWVDMIIKMNRMECDVKVCANVISEEALEDLTSKSRRIACETSEKKTILFGVDDWEALTTGLKEQGYPNDLCSKHVTVSDGEWESFDISDAYEFVCITTFDGKQFIGKAETHHGAKLSAFRHLFQFTTREEYPVSTCIVGMLADPRLEYQFDETVYVTYKMFNEDDLFMDTN